MRQRSDVFSLHAEKRNLDKVLFPIGHLNKISPRDCREHGLATAEKKDSTGICFIGERKFREFIGDYIPYQEGA